MYVVLLRGQGAVADTTAPLISQVMASDVSDSGATISWSTDEPADSRVEFGLAPGSYDWSVEDSLLVHSHSLELIGLTPDTQYHYRVRSQDAWDNPSASQERTFVTKHELPGVPGEPIHFDD
jgi:chitodextrinase